MKKILFSVLIISIAGSAFAGDRRDSEKRHSSPVTDEIEAILADEADTVITSLTFGELENLLGRVSIPMQKAAYIQQSSVASMMMPGKGQFMNGDTLSGALFLSGDLLVTAGTLVGGYFLLPSELQFGQLDYFNLTHTEIKDAWTAAAESMTLKDALPTLGVMAGGALLHSGIRAFSARHAAALARDNIEEGKVTFEARTSFFTSGHGRMGVGMGMRY